MCLQDLRMQKEAHISQLRSLNALLERQVADLEEERRKLRMEMKFRAKCVCASWRAFRLETGKCRGLRETVLFHASA